MGRHSKEGDSQPLTAASSGRHRTQRKIRSISLTSFFRRSRHRPHAAPNPNVFHHEGADAAWSGTLAGIVATTKPNMRPVPRPEPLPEPLPEPEPAPTPVQALYPAPQLAREFVEALMGPAPHSTVLDLSPTAHLDSPGYYRRLVEQSRHSVITLDAPTLTLPLVSTSA